MKLFFKTVVLIFFVKNSWGQTGTYGWSSPAYTAGNLTWTSSDGKVQSIITTNFLNAWGNGYSSPEVYPNTNQNQDASYNCGINGGLTLEVFFGNTTTSYTQQVIDFTSGSSTNGMCSNVSFYITDINQDIGVGFSDCISISAIDGTGAAINVSASGTGTITGNNTTLVNIVATFNGTCAPQLNVTVNPPAGRTLKTITIKYYPNPTNGCNSSGYYNFNSGCPSNGSCGSCWRPALQWISISPISLTASGGGCIVIMPIELLSFTGKCNGNNKTLEWITASETNNDYFTIEKSPDGKEWNEIGKVKGAGNSSTVHNYEFVDGSLPSPMGEGSGVRYYYKLKQTDYNGKYEYVGYIPIEPCSPDEWKLILQTIFSEEELQGTLVATEDANVWLSILDMQGRIIRKEKLRAVRGSNVININIGDLDKGIYFIKANNNKQNIISKFVRF